MEEVGQRDPSARTIVSNHWSQVDILVFMSVVFPGFVAKVCAGSVRVHVMSRCMAHPHRAAHPAPAIPQASTASLTLVGDVSRALQSVFVTADKHRHSNQAGGQASPTPSGAEAIKARQHLLADVAKNGMPNDPTAVPAPVTGMAKVADAALRALEAWVVTCWPNPNQDTVEADGSSLDDVMPPLVVFSESSTSNCTAVLRMRTGAFLANEPVQPVLLRYHWAFGGMSWETIPTGWWLQQMLSAPYMGVQITWLPVLRPKELGCSTPTEFASAVQAAMRAWHVASSHTLVCPEPDEAAAVRTAIVGDAARAKSERAHLPADPVSLDAEARVVNINAAALPACAVPAPVRNWITPWGRVPLPLNPLQVAVGGQASKRRGCASVLLRVSSWASAVVGALPWPLQQACAACIGLEAGRGGDDSLQWVAPSDSAWVTSDVCETSAKWELHKELTSVDAMKNDKWQWWADGRASGRAPLPIWRVSVRLPDAGGEEHSAEDSRASTTKARRRARRW